MIQTIAVDILKWNTLETHCDLLFSFYQVLYWIRATAAAVTSKSFRLWGLTQKKFLSHVKFWSVGGPVARGGLCALKFPFWGFTLLTLGFQGRCASLLEEERTGGLFIAGLCGPDPPSCSHSAGQGSGKTTYNWERDFSHSPGRRESRSPTPNSFLIKKTKCLNFPLCLSYFKSNILPVDKNPNLNLCLLRLA